MSKANVYNWIKKMSKKIIAEENPEYLELDELYCYIEKSHMLKHMKILI